MNKKSSINLSINAIVVLILAIAMLGLALGFIKTMFGKTSAQVEAIAASEPEPRLANPQEPLTLSRETLVLRPSEKTAIKFSAYNNPSQDLVGYWSFDENDGSALTDSSGKGNNGAIYGNTVLLMNFDDGTAEDKSGYKNDGTLRNGLTCNANGINNKGCSFDGVDDYINIVDSNSLDITGEITISAWIYPIAEYVGYAAHPINKWTSINDANYVLYYFGTTSGVNKRIRFYANAGGTWKDISGDYELVNLNTWYHVVLSYNPTTGGKLYINGNPQGASTGTGNLATNSANLRIGGAVYFPGLIDEVAIYKKALTPEEIQQLYSAQKAKFIEWTAGKSGTALSFDGIDDIITVTQNPSLNFNDEITVMAWVNFDNFNNNLGAAIGKAADSPPKGFGIEKTGGSSSMSFWIADGTDWLGVKSSTLNANQWYHFTGTFEGTTISLYQDGALVATRTQQGYQSGTANIVMGGHATLIEASRYFDGKIDEVAIYNRALTPDEIKASAEANLLAVGKGCISASDTTPAQPLKIVSQASKTSEPGKSVNSLAVIQAYKEPVDTVCEICTTAIAGGGCTGIRVIVK